MQRRPAWRRFRLQPSTQIDLPVRLTPRLRQAQFSGSGISNTARPFTTAQLSELEAFQPQVLIGTAAELSEVAGYSATGACELSSVDYALIVLTCPGMEPLSDVDRVVLWQAFAVPVYEVLATRDVPFLAAECEAHDGWHIQAGFRASLTNGEAVLQRGSRMPVSTGFAAEIESNKCACGRETARLMNPRRILRSRPALAATA
jgi:phenylacetate-coenzyme A ligase PaaK-like adenylate-forming protein